MFGELLHAWQDSGDGAFDRCSHRSALSPMGTCCVPPHSNFRIHEPYGVREGSGDASLSLLSRSVCGEVSLTGKLSPGFVSSSDELWKIVEVRIVSSRLRCWCFVDCFDGKPALWWSVCFWASFCLSFSKVKL